ncbi:Purine-binding protein [Xylophilus ampelinus]|nr:BMP family ABC transporter substrate-binding protein [Variovorax sp.]VTY32961.1 Purine-binding protein [Xylophilus ampelinus]
MRVSRRLGLLSLTLPLACALVSPASAQGFTLKGEPKIAMLLFGPRTDGGWTQAFEEARVKMEKELGAKIQFVESIPEDASIIKPTAERFIARGANIVIGTAFGYSDSFKDLAAKYPNVAFLNASGTTNAANLESFYGRTYESQYLCGLAAGAASKTGKLGFVAGNPVGSVNWTINAFALGAQKANPKATVNVIYTGAWNDPVKERAAASALLDQGIDVIGQHVDTPTPQIVAQERGRHGTGLHRDMSAYAPKATLCSAVWAWDRFLVPEVRKVIAGNWTPPAQGALVPMSGGGTDIALGAVLPKELAARVMAERDALMKGRQVYAGPLKDRDGKERVPAGAVLSDADLWKMDWFVPGVVTQK